MTVKKLIFALAAAGATLSASAYEYPYLRFSGSDGSESYINCEGLTLRLEDGVLVAENGTESLRLDPAGLDHMCFATSTQGVGAIADTSAESSVTVYSLSGVRVGQWGDIASARVALSPGLYIVKQAGKVTKLAVR